MKVLTILGSTGSIGTQTLQVVREHRNMQVAALSANSNIELLETQIREFNPRLVCVADENKAKELKIKIADTDVRVTSGTDGICEAAAVDGADIAVIAVVGISGLLPTIEAIKSGKDIALANKETLVAGGHIVTKLAKEYNINILPVDSEHSAIFQSISHQDAENKIKNILLTASGGPFCGKKRQELDGVSTADALNHPNWDMGAKVTVDSSTLVNKGLEVIEAKWLFDVDIDRIKVLVHRQSIVHSMVQFEDNAVIAQLGIPDMRLPIQYALTYPKRLPMSGNEIDFFDISALTFERPDIETFGALKLAYDAGRYGGVLPCVFNGADEAAVRMFLQERIRYLQIEEIIENTMSNAPNIQDPTLDDILTADIWAKEFAESFVK